MRELGLEPEQWEALFAAPIYKVAHADGNLSEDEQAVLCDQRWHDIARRRLLNSDVTVSRAVALLSEIVAVLPGDERQQARQWLATSLRRVLRPAGQSELDTVRRLWEELGLEEVGPAPTDTIQPPADARVARPGEADRSARETIDVTRPTPVALVRDVTVVQRQEWSNHKGCLDHVSKPGDIASLDIRIIVFDEGIGVVPRAALQGVTLYFVADLHGDLATLTRVLETTRFSEDPSVWLVFLGDYGDRGPKTADVLLTVLDLKRRHPGRVVLLRGNHEFLRPNDATGQLVTDPSLPVTTWSQGTTDDGYSEAVEEVFVPAVKAEGRDHDAAFWLVKSLFDSLPVALVFEDGLVAVHGGIVPRFPTEVPMKGTLSARRQEELSIREIADLRKPAVRNHLVWCRCDYKDLVIFVWNDDPHSGASFDYGDLKAFFAATGTHRLVRGHDHPQQARIDCEDRLLTLCTSHAMDGPVWQCTPQIARYRPDLLPAPIVVP